MGGSWCFLCYEDHGAEQTEELREPVICVNREVKETYVVETVEWRSIYRTAFPYRVT